MENLSIISGVIGGLASVVLCTYISKSAWKAKVEGELKFGNFQLILSLCCLSFVGFAVWAFFNDADAWERPSELYAIIALFIGFGIASIYSFAEYFKVRGTFNAKNIEFYTPWTGKKAENWNDLKSVKFNPLGYWHTLSFKSGQKIRISSLISGHGEVLELIASKGYDISQD